MLNQSQINKVIHDWIQLLTSLNGANIRPQRNKFGFNLVDSKGKPLAFDTTICMFYAGLSDEIIDKQFIDYDSVSMLKSLSVSMTFIGDDADQYATMIQSLAYGRTSRNYLQDFGFALYGDITETINDKEYSEKWYYRRTLNATFNVVVDFKPQSVPDEFSIQSAPINVNNISGIAQTEPTGPLDPVKVYKESRDPNWLNMMGDNLGENYDDMKFYYESHDNELRLLFHLYPPNDNLFNIRIITSDGSPYTVSYSKADGSVITQSVDSNTYFYANLDYNDFGYEFDMQNDIIGTGTRQVLIIITGNNITNISFQASQQGKSNLKINIADFMGKCSSLSNISLNTTLCYMKYFALFGNNNINGMANLFGSCFGLVCITDLYTEKVTNMGGLFSSCYSLIAIPYLNTINCKNMTSMFSECRSLQHIPLFDTKNLISMNGMFNNCFSLIEIPAFNIDNVNGNYRDLFSNCNSLKKINLIFKTQPIDMYRMFNYCYSLQKLPYGLELNSSNAGSESQKSNYFSYTFFFCYSLNDNINIDCQGYTNASNLFYYCTNIKKINFLNTNLISSFTNAFLGMYNIQEITGLDFSGVTTTGTISFTQCYSLKKLEITATNWEGRNITIQGCSLGYQALLDLLNGLPQVTTNPTFTMRNNVGSQQLSNEIASGNPPEQYTKAVNNGWIIAL